MQKEIQRKMKRNEIWSTAVEFQCPNPTQAPKGKEIYNNINIPKE